jgi:coenzyme F420-reducing hydrogenase alpha subunit
VFDLRNHHPEIFEEAFSLRRSAMHLVQLFGKRDTHPVTLAPGRFLESFDETFLLKGEQTAADLRGKIRTILFTSTLETLSRKHGHCSETAVEHGRCSRPPVACAVRRGVDAR